MKLGDFSSQADAYRRSRPAYPDALLDRLVAHVGVAAGDPVADIGAGTGISTAQLAARGLHVVAVEPGEKMRALAPAIEGVEWRDGSFENTGLPTGSQRWVVAAQAFHWADRPRALPELYRVLAPGGHFSALWNDRQPERDPVVGWTRRLIAQLVPEFEQAYRDKDWPALLTEGGWLCDVHADEQAHVVVMSRERYLDLWRSHNHLQTLAGPERFASFLTQLEAHLSDIDEVPVPYMCRAFTARRSDSHT